MKITTAFDITQIVFLLTDPEQTERMITCIQVQPNNLHLYQLTMGSTTSWHYDFELVAERSIHKLFSS